MMTNEAVEMLCERATEVAAFLKLVANEQRLLLLCRLREGEASVGELVGLCNLSQSSVSQHLARMRDGGLVQTRRETTTIYYSIANQRVLALMQFLCENFGEK
ncbi:MAG: metalloregulator ArsR/SmtB family transcription factor [Alphaproteobacteria bacterium]|nr:metalloregulator ArsR/SmtB family transcription factor [Alphaproteobacteria bacterium]MBU0824576.1 metalloregulator ArsR/SmtB family transcription factor [Alphaproteobacteria bacterium]MBU0869331.1 metalloregulator ArsR/SmtB family transcription factor [Alphaproteobacteria bacterium]MBU1462175.1 metalloregulator ArsR/SmtB family transcription factor [Alphaproteobacteria bacterium]MBU1796243.1 metalloregulator ArsR/SmtB family transcription factor [Alphaproteobacteria bacterium]